MSFVLKNFGKDKRGTTFEGVALSVSILAVAFVASADMLDYATKEQGTTEITASHQLATPANVASADLDTTPTATTLPQLQTHSVLDPCTGRVK